MLLGGAVAVICCYVNRYSLTEMLKVLLASLLLFLIIGLFAKGILDKYVPYVEAQDEEAAPDEGSVIEKNGEDADSEYDEENANYNEGESEDDRY